MTLTTSAVSRFGVNGIACRGDLMLAEVEARLGHVQGPTVLHPLSERANDKNPSPEAHAASRITCPPVRNVIRTRRPWHTPLAGAR